jgi:hypothetical protein
MYEFHLDDMLEALIKARVLQLADKKKARKVLDKYWSNKIAISWQTCDVIDRAKEQGKKVTEEQAKEVLSRCLHKHDCNIGMSWDTIDFWTDEIV